MHNYTRSTLAGGPLPPGTLPVNTHGGLMHFGAPWELPALYGVGEAVLQLTGRAGDRQVQGARSALVYGNGGVFSSSAVAVLRRKESTDAL
jgi:acetyl-CoA acetyltransferase